MYTWNCVRRYGEISQAMAVYKQLWSWSFSLIWFLCCRPASSQAVFESSFPPLLCPMLGSYYKLCVCRNATVMLASDDLNSVVGWLAGFIQTPSYFWASVCLHVGEIIIGTRRRIKELRMPSEDVTNSAFIISDHRNRLVVHKFVRDMILIKFVLEKLR